MRPVSGSTPPIPSPRAASASTGRVCPCPSVGPTTTWCFLPAGLVLVSEAFGKRFTVAEDRGKDDHAIIISCLQHVLRLRRRLRVETINDKRAAGHAFLEEIRDHVDIAADHRGVELRLGPSSHI